MHCNLRSTDVAPVMFRFNGDSHTKLEVAQPIRTCLMAFLLVTRYVTL